MDGQIIEISKPALFSKHRYIIILLPVPTFKLVVNLLGNRYTASALRVLWVKNIFGLLALDHLALSILRIESVPVLANLLAALIYVLWKNTSSQNLIVIIIKWLSYRSLITYLD